MPARIAFGAALGLVLIAGLDRAASAQCVWGSFDETRINYPGGVLSTGVAHSMLRDVIAGGSGSIAPGTPELTPAYLDGVDVFYTSLLKDDGVPLSSAEAASLQAWFAAGGTLIVTADIFNLPGYESFTSFLGVTNYAAIGDAANAKRIAGHPLSVGVPTVGFSSNSTFDIPANARGLYEDANGNLFAAVMDPPTGFAGPGRLFVVGDHNLFANTLIGSPANTQFAENMVRWACVPSPAVPAVLLAALAWRRRR